MSAKLAKGVSLTEIEGKAVLFAMRTGDTFGLSETAAVFLRALLKGTFESAVVAVTDSYDADPKAVGDDMRELLAELERMKLLERA
ncbi:MAG: PqqD family protein [Myxococcales bacterium]|nr:PqqD family protein [Myxococcales bacterium]